LSKVLVIFFSLSSLVSYAQLKTKKYDIDKIGFSCPPANQEIKELFYTAFEALKEPEHVNTAGRILLNIITKDSKMCDAYFWLGVSLTEQSKHKNAVLYYYYADSLAPKSNLMYKRELAEAAIRVGVYGLAEQKYEELIEQFSSLPDGFLGMGILATTVSNAFPNEEDKEIEDFQTIGLKNLIIAEEKYKAQKQWNKANSDKVHLTKAILFTLKRDYKQAIANFEVCKETYFELDEFNANYALACDEFYMQTKDEKWKKEALEAFNRIKNRESLNESFIKRFQK
jgi:tetratricopeptide (TPR) repeat protein